MACERRMIGFTAVVVPRPLLRVGAVVFLAAMTGYSAALIYYNRYRFPPASIGLRLAEDEQPMRVEHVDADGPAARAGVHTGDVVLAIDGRPLTTILPLWDVVDRGRTGAFVRLTVQGPSDVAPRDVSVQLAPFKLPAALQRLNPTYTKLLALQVLSLFPIPFLIVAAIVLLHRYFDFRAWLLALMLGAFVAGVDLPNFLPVVHPWLRKPMLTYFVLLATVPPGALYTFFALFPEPTALDRKVPWLKYLLLGVPLGFGTILAIVTLVNPGRPFYLSPGLRSTTTQPAFDVAMGVYSLLGYGLGLVSLILNSFYARPETKRRTRVMLWGTAGALLPITALGIYMEATKVEFLELPFWLWVGAVAALLLLPISLAYAIVKHRVMEIPVLLRRSARYVVVHHAIVVFGIVIGVALTFVFAYALSRTLPDTLVATVWAERVSGVAGAVFGVIVAMTTRRGVQKATERLDRAFFRGAYDARRLLQDLARQTRTAADPRQLAGLLESSLAEALHPTSIAVLLRTDNDRLEPVAPIGMTQPMLDGKNVERESFGQAGLLLIKAGELPASLSSLSTLQPDLIAPMHGLAQRLEGLLVLGPRLSEEPYGREDRELIASIASQAGTALENFRLARAMAERMEAERVADRELEIAREVQAKLLPQQTPALDSLDYAGICIQARQVGGDYYDFLYLGPGRLGLVLADISGKGISAALLMASLQASLRSHYAQAPDDVPRVLQAVNHTFFESTATSRYATLFFGIYDEGTARLRYANCGHPPPVLFASNGSIERLLPTGPVVGLFEEWSCTTREIDLTCHDTLVMFTDGVVESFNAHGDEFGEERLVDVVRRQGNGSAACLLDSLVEAVRLHSGPAQSDDFTLVVARVRELRR